LLIKSRPIKREIFDAVELKATKLEAENNALRNEIKVLRAWVSRIAAGNITQKDALLANVIAPSGSRPRPSQMPAQDLPGGGRTVSIPIRVRDCPPRNIMAPIVSFLPEDSFTSTSGDAPTDLVSPKSYESFDYMSYEQPPLTFRQPFLFSPWSRLSRGLMRVFFDQQYQYHMSLYREFFLRDFDLGGGPYYSDLLMFAICAIGALASDDGASREISDSYFSQAQQILYGSALEFPDLTTVQALLLMGHREIGLGNMSKGWMLSRMAFSLAHEMGLHLDPNNWEQPTLGGQEEANSRRRDKEILRRTYWAAFIADKQLSLYFGRPPALCPSQADVHMTTRITYPPGWELLLNKHIKQGVFENLYEDGRQLVAFWVQQIELSKLSHRMIVEVFENRNTEVGEEALAASIEDIHLALLKWHAKLGESDLHWIKS
jgi:hypothetical protein